MNTWMFRAAFVLALLIFAAVHGMSIWMVLDGKITGELYMGTWGPLAGTAVGAVLMWLKKDN